MELSNLRMLIELATTSRDAAAVRCAQAQGHVTQARQQLDTLRGYVADYERRGQATLSEGCDIAVQSNLRAFAAKLKRAVEQQSAEVERRRQVLAAAEAELAQMQRKLTSLQTLAGRQAETLRLHAARREQKATDETARTMAQVTGLSPLTGGAW